MLRYSFIYGAIIGIVVIAFMCVVLFALGTLTTVFSFLVIGLFLLVFWILDRRRQASGSDAGKGMV